MTEVSDSGLPAVQRVVTGHDSSGKATIASEDFAGTRMVPTGDAAFLLIWATDSVPANNNDSAGDPRDRSIGLIDKGSVIRIVDVLPGKESPMHRTSSIDYGIVLSGEIELELDDGSTTTVRQGGIIVQRGTNHLWRNRTDAPCRIVFVLIEAPAYLHEGKPLDPIVPGAEH